MPDYLARVNSVPGNVRAPKYANGFRIRRIFAKDHGVRYQTFQVVGYLDGQLIRKKFKSREDAVTARDQLAVTSANRDGNEIRPVNTCLIPAQGRAAELAIGRLGNHSLPDAIEWFLANYRPPVSSVPIEMGAAEFMRDRESEATYVSPP